MTVTGTKKGKKRMKALATPLPVGRTHAIVTARLATNLSDRWRLRQTEREQDLAQLLFRPSQVVNNAHG